MKTLKEFLAEITSFYPRLEGPAMRKGTCYNCKRENQLVKVKVGKPSPSTGKMLPSWLCPNCYKHKSEDE